MNGFNLRVIFFPHAKSLRTITSSAWWVEIGFRKKYLFASLRLLFFLLERIGINRGKIGLLYFRVPSTILKFNSTQKSHEVWKKFHTSYTRDRTGRHSCKTSLKSKYVNLSIPYAICQIIVYCGLLVLV